MVFCVCPVKILNIHFYAVFFFKVHEVNTCRESRVSITFGVSLWKLSGEFHFGHHWSPIHHSIFSWNAEDQIQREWSGEQPAGGYCLSFIATFQFDYLDTQPPQKINKPVSRRLLQPLSVGQIMATPSCATGFISGTNFKFSVVFIFSCAVDILKSNILKASHEDRQRCTRHGRLTLNELATSKSVGSQ